MDRNTREHKQRIAQLELTGMAEPDLLVRDFPNPQSAPTDADRRPPDNRLLQHPLSKIVPARTPKEHRQLIRAMGAAENRGRWYSASGRHIDAGRSDSLGLRSLCSGPGPGFRNQAGPLLGRLCNSTPVRGSPTPTTAQRRAPGPHRRYIIRVGQVRPPSQYPTRCEVSCQTQMQPGHGGPGRRRHHADQSSQRNLFARLVCASCCRGTSHSKKPSVASNWCEAQI